MIAPELHFVKERDCRLLFAARSWIGLLVIAFIGGVSCSLVASGAPTYVLFLFSPVFALFLVMGVLASFWRYKLTLDLVSRTYSARKGFWPFVRRRDGSLDELDGVVLTTHSGPGEGNEPAWAVSLLFRNWESPVSIVITFGELDAEMKLRHWAARLGVRAIDRTGITEKIISPDRADEDDRVGLRPDPPSREALSALLAAGRYELINERGLQTIILPRRRTSASMVAEAVMVMIFSAGFMLLGVGAVSSMLTGYPVIEGSRLGLWIIAPLFIGVALAAFLIITTRTWGREWLQISADELVFGTLKYGRIWRKIRVRREGIREIDIKQYEGLRRKIRTVTILTDRRTLRIGQTLEPDELKWLYTILQTSLNV